MTKIDIISGFLGAGKTTLIKKLLADAYRGEQVVLIENEFGEIGIDGSFLKEAGVEIREMNSGCICCSLVGDFGTALHEVVEKYHPDRIVIEPSGVGKLSDVIRAVEDVQERCGIELNTYTTVADVKKCKMYLRNFGEFFSNQIEFAGTIVLSRTDVATEDKVKQAVELIREINPRANIITTPVEKLGGKKVLEVMENEKADLERELLEAQKEHDHHHHDGECCGHDHHHHDGECCEHGHHHGGEHCGHGHEEHNHGDHEGHEHHGHDHEGTAIITPTRYLRAGVVRRPANIPAWSCRIYWTNFLPGRVISVLYCGLKAWWRIPTEPGIILTWFPESARSGMVRRNLRDVSV